MKPAIRNLQQTALLTIDMQNDFVLTRSPFYIKESQSILPRIAKVLQSFRRKKYLLFIL